MLNNYVQNYISPIVQKLTPTNENKEKIYNLTQKIKNFILENKGTVFLVATTLGALAVSGPTLIAEAPVLTIVAFGALAACGLRAFSKMFNVKKESHETSEAISLMTGCANLIALYINPAFGLGCALFNAGMRGCSLAFRHVCQM